MSNKSALSIIICTGLIFFAAMGTWKPLELSAQSTLLPDNLAIFYGYPSLVNGSGGDLNAATEVFNDYDLVVFGDGLQESTHDDHGNTVTIISNLKTPPNNTAVYGYIPIGMTTENLSMAEIKRRVDLWVAMGVVGIFLDEAGYDFGVTRMRQNDAVNYVHGQGLQGLKVFINAWNPDDVFSDAVDATYNPDRLPTHLGLNDIYLHESFQIASGRYQDLSFWADKSDKALAYKNQFGTQMATVTTARSKKYDQGKFDYAWWSTLLYGFDAMGWGDPDYSAKDSKLPYRQRPNPGEIGNFTSSEDDAVIHVPPVHKRPTTAGEIQVNTDTHTGEFLPSNSPYRLIIFTCVEDTGGLVVSEVTLEGTVKDTISGMPTTLGNKGVTEAELCGIGGAQYNSLGANTYAPDVKVPK